MDEARHLAESIESGTHQPAFTAGASPNALSTGWSDVSSRSLVVAARVSVVNVTRSKSRIAFVPWDLSSVRPGLNTRTSTPLALASRTSRLSARANSVRANIGNQIFGSRAVTTP